MNGDGARALVRAVRMAVAMLAAVGVVVAHGLGRPSGGLREEVSLGAPVRLEVEKKDDVRTQEQLPEGLDLRRVPDELSPPRRPPGRPLWLEMGRAGKEVELRGTVADETQRADLMSVLRSSGGRVSDGLAVGGEAVSSPAWWPELLRLIELFLRDSEEGTVQVAGEMIQISGRMKTAGHREDFFRLTRELKRLPDCELSLVWPEPEPAAMLPAQGSAAMRWGETER